MTEAGERAAGRPPAWLRPAGLALGALLLAAAVIAVARQHETIGEALRAVRHPSVLNLVVLPGTVLLNLALTGLMFSLLMSRRGRVGLMEMQAIISAAALLNFLPLRPGLLGRIAYHRAYHAIPAAATVKVTLHALALTSAVAAYMVAALLVAGRTAVPLWAAVGLPVVGLGAATAVPALRFHAAAALIRYAEVLVFAWRYHAAFSLLGSPVGPGSALAFACINVAAMLIPFLGNGLGVREWAVGLAAPLLTPYELAIGLAADLVNRAAELVVVAIAGLVAIAWLARRRG